MVGVVVGRGHISVDPAGLFPDQFKRPRAMGFGQSVEKNVLAAEGAKDRRFERGLDFVRHSDKRQIRQVDDIGSERREDFEELLQFDPLSTVFTLENRDGQSAERVRFDGAGPTRETAEQGGSMPLLVENANGS